MNMEERLRDSFREVPRDITTLYLKDIIEMLDEKDRKAQHVQDELQYRINTISMYAMAHGRNLKNHKEFMQMVAEWVKEI